MRTALLAVLAASLLAGCGISPTLPETMKSASRWTFTASTDLRTAFRVIDTRYRACMAFGGTLGGIAVHSNLEPAQQLGYVETLGIQLNSPSAGQLDKHARRVVIRQTAPGQVTIEVGSPSSGAGAYRSAWDVLNWITGSVSCVHSHTDEPDPRIQPAKDQSEWRTLPPERMATP
jgi:hypothetical protein